MGAHIIAQTSLGAHKSAHTSAHTSPHTRMGAHTIAHMSAHTCFGAHTSLGAHTSATCHMPPIIQRYSVVNPFITNFWNMWISHLKLNLSRICHNWNCLRINYMAGKGPFTFTHDVSNRRGVSWFLSKIWLSLGGVGRFMIFLTRRGWGRGGTVKEQAIITSFFSIYNFFFIKPCVI